MTCRPRPTAIKVKKNLLILDLPPHAPLSQRRRGTLGR
jgi:hypothetical protein